VRRRQPRSRWRDRRALDLLRVALVGERAGRPVPDVRLRASRGERQ
jgi:hypothetical protein